MIYTYIDEKTKEEIEEICRVPKLFRLSRRECYHNPSYFMYHYLGLKPFSYQYMVMEAFRKGYGKLIMCTSRQVGKSIMLAVLALWCAFHNTHPGGIGKNTTVGIISHTEDQSRKIINEIRKLISIGDRRVAHITDGRIRKQYSSQIDQNSPNNTTQITFKNNCWIKSFPPTNKARGESFSLLFIDEAAYVDKLIFTEVLEPTVSATNGKIILTSTPKGMGNYFFELFDPYDEQGCLDEEHEYKRFWFQWEQCENEVQRKKIEEKKVLAEKTGNMKSFRQEYEARFEEDTTAFFSAKFVDGAVDEKLNQIYEWKRTECSMGIDYGITESKTVITVSTQMEDGTIQLLSQFVYPPNQGDISIIGDVQDLMGRYNITKIVVDKCPQGYKTNNEMIALGWPVEEFNFRSAQETIRSEINKNRGYYGFRAKLCQGKIKIPPIKELIKEMKTLQEEQRIINVSIHKPKHGSDDRIDSFMMSTIEWITDDNDKFDAKIVNAPDFKTMEKRAYRCDPVWDFVQQNPKFKFTHNQLGGK